MTIMKTRECPYCGKIISLKNCLKYLFKGTSYPTTCNHCHRKVELVKEPLPFKYCVIAGFLSIYLPMNFFLYISKLSFLEALLYTLPFFILCVGVIAFLTFRNMFFK